MKLSTSNNQSPGAKKSSVTVGIDLGTTNSLISSYYQGDIIVYSDVEKRFLLPSAVQYGLNGIKVGYEARNAALEDPENTILSIKRMLGLSFKEIQEKYSNTPYTFQASKKGPPLIKTVSGLVTPAHVSSEILKSLVTRVKNNNIKGAVITVPAYFDDMQRQHTKQAAQLAGINVLRLLNEPTAAAIAYGLEKSRQKGLTIVYDLGGGTFDVSVLNLNESLFEVLATSGNSSLGGDDFDLLLAKYIEKKADLRKENSSFNRRQVLETAIKTKILLSTHTTVDVRIAKWKGSISREEFNILILPYVKNTLKICQTVLKDALVKIEEVRKIVMVGGSTRIPLVREYVSKFFSQKLLKNIDADKVVSVGAALQAYNLISRKNTKNRFLLLDVLPLSLGIETIGGVVEKILPKNINIPASREKEFTTFKDNQTAMSIHVVQGEDELVKNCRSLSKFTLHSIPQLPAGKARVRVTFQVDANGLLLVSAYEKSTGTKTSVKINYYDNLHQEEARQKRDDKHKSEANDLTETIMSTISKNKFLDSKASQKIKNATEQLQEAIKGNNTEDIKNKTTFLENLSQKFFDKKMSISIDTVFKKPTVKEK